VGHDTAVKDKEATLVEGQAQGGPEHGQPKCTVFYSGGRLDDDLPTASNEEGAHLLDIMARFLTIRPEPDTLPVEDGGNDADRPEADDQLSARPDTCRRDTLQLR
jgi:hypothetical protein